MSSLTLAEKLTIAAIAGAIVFLAVVLIVVSGGQVAPDLSLHPSPQG
ncbi:MAG TPA: hypothetical protein VGK63_12535 [Candidatus Limnocylindrales bacterium]